MRKIIIEEKRRAYNRAYYLAHKEQMKVYRLAHREERLVYSRAYDAAHREEIKIYRLSHRDEKRARDKVYNTTHREQIAAYQKNRYEENREQRLAQMRIYHKEHREQDLIRSKTFHYKKEYGITPEEKLLLLSDQRGVCAICGTKDFGKQGPHIDHDHSPGGKIRGILCQGCNQALGLIYENPYTAISMFGYIRRFEVTE